LTKSIDNNNINNNYGNDINANNFSKKTDSSSSKLNKQNSRRTNTDSTMSSSATVITDPIAVHKNTTTSKTTTSTSKAMNLYQQQRNNKLVAIESNVIHMSLQRIIQLLYNLLSRSLPLIMMNVANTTTTTFSTSSSSNNTINHYLHPHHHHHHHHSNTSNTTINRDSLLSLILQLLSTIIPLHSNQFLSYWPLFLADSYSNNQLLISTCNHIITSSIFDIYQFDHCVTHTRHTHHHHQQQQFHQNGTDRDALDSSSSLRTKVCILVYK
jgi:hypothetical protein